MSGKKKVSILASLALCVTIGGTYAAWIYSDENIELDPTHRHVEVRLEDLGTSTNRGTFDALTSGVKFVIDQQAGSAHIAELKWTNTTDKIPVYFCPSVNAQDTVKEQGVDVMFYFQTSGKWDFGGTVGEDYVYAYPTMTVTNEETQQQETVAKTFKVAMSAMGSDYNGDGINDFQGWIPTEFIKDSITLKNQLKLGTLDEYNAFKAKLGGNVATNINVGITIAEDDGTAVAIPDSYYQNLS